MVSKFIRKLQSLNFKEQLNGKYLPLLISMLIIVGYMFCIDKKIIKTPKFLMEKVIVEKEVTIEKEKEVIKYIEKENMKTSEFITHINPRIDAVIAEEIGRAVDKYSKEYQIPKKLILAIIRKESFFNPFAKSTVAFGLMQVYPKFHQEKLKNIGIKDNREIYHIDKNINIGCQIFKEYFDASNGDLDETFHKYLSKRATKQQRDAYKNDILTAWARMEFMEYLRKNQKQLEIEDPDEEQEN